MQSCNSGKVQRQEPCVQESKVRYVYDVWQQAQYRGEDCQAESFHSFHGVTALHMERTSLFFTVFPLLLCCFHPLTLQQLLKNLPVFLLFL